MKKYRYIYEIQKLNHFPADGAGVSDVLPALAPDSLFLDIETTGFSRSSTYLTIIGLAWQDGKKIVVEQWLNESGHKEEVLLLLELERFLKGKSLPHLIHYNGTTFDLPYLKGKYDQYHLPSSLADCKCTDLYHLAKKYKHFLGLTGLKQRQLEEAFGLFRKDQLSGEALIEAYLTAIQYKDTELLDAYLLHNKEDMEGMVFLQNLIALDWFLDGDYKIDISSQDSMDFSIFLTGNLFLPRCLSMSAAGIHFSIQTGQASIQLPIRHMELKYFYDNYKDYYYLPAEDCAMHKSVAAYVEKEYRQKATKENCYSKKIGNFLPLPLPDSLKKRKEVLKELSCFSFFYQCYGDCTAWISIDSLKKEQMPLYVKHLLSLFLFSES